MLWWFLLLIIAILTAVLVVKVFKLGHCGNGDAAAITVLGIIVSFGVIIALVAWEWLSGLKS